LCVLLIAVSGAHAYRTGKTPLSNTLSMLKATKVEAFTWTKNDSKPSSPTQAVPNLVQVSSEKDPRNTRIISESTKRDTRLGLVAEPPGLIEADLELGCSTGQVERSSKFQVSPSGSVCPSIGLGGACVEIQKQSPHGDTQDLSHEVVTSEHSCQQLEEDRIDAAGNAQTPDAFLADGDEQMENERSKLPPLPQLQRERSNQAMLPELPALDTSIPQDTIAVRPTQENGPSPPPPFSPPPLLPPPPPHFRPSLQQDAMEDTLQELENSSHHDVKGLQFGLARGAPCHRTMLADATSETSLVPQVRSKDIVKGKVIAPNKTWVWDAPNKAWVLDASNGSVGHTRSGRAAQKQTNAKRFSLARQPSATRFQWASSEKSSDSDRPLRRGSSLYENKDTMNDQLRRVRRTLMTVGSKRGRVHAQPQTIRRNR